MEGKQCSSRQAGSLQAPDLDLGCLKIQIHAISFFGTLKVKKLLFFLLLHFVFLLSLF